MRPAIGRRHLPPSSTARVTDRRPTLVLPYHLAFTDVVRAFNHFAEQTEGRPVVILGHSQGGLHTRRLVSDVVAKDEELKKRLVAAYVAGIPIPLGAYEDELNGFEPCRSANDTGCVVSW